MMLLSVSGPIVVPAFIAVVVVAVAALSAVSAIAFRRAEGDALVRRGVLVAVVWVAVAGALAGVGAYIATEDDDASAGSASVGGRTSTPAAPPATATVVIPGVDARVTLRGTLTLDGAPLEASSLGVRVMRGGLAAACQEGIPAVTGGKYEIQVLAEAENRSCGADGANMLLWAFATGRIIWARETIPWLKDGATTSFDATFSLDTPEGASKAVTELSGIARHRDGTLVSAGTVIEARIGEKLCAVTSKRYSQFDEYILIVAGPDSVPGCARNAQITFLVDGKRADETAVNDMGSSQQAHELDLTID